MGQHGHFLRLNFQCKNRAKTSLVAGAVIRFARAVLHLGEARLTRRRRPVVRLPAQPAAAVADHVAVQTGLRLRRAVAAAEGGSLFFYFFILF